MHTYTITVTQLVSDENLSEHDDLLDNPSGSYTYEAPSESDALDEFHNHIAIGCLDDFNIDVECDADTQVTLALTEGQADFVKALLYQGKSDADPKDKPQNDFIDTLIDQVEQSIEGNY